MRANVLLAVALVSCSVLPKPSLPSREATLERASNVVWHDAYKRKDKPPLVHVVQGEELACSSEINGLPGFDCPTVGCRQGCTFNPWSVMVATSDKWYRSTLAHEFKHAQKMRQAYEAGTVGAALQLAGDRDHTAADWQPGADVDLANARLSELDL